MTALTVRLKHGAGPKIVEAFPTGVPGLMLHAAVGLPGWSLTHPRSGNGIAWFPPSVNVEAVLACARELGHVADWTQSAEDLLHGGAIERARPIAARWGFIDRGVTPDDLSDLPEVAP